MSKFRFALSSQEARHEGTIDGLTFVDAVDSIWEHVDIRRGDVLEIGVQGFPPARFECASVELTGKPMWSQAA
jgi:hypothetical protein